MSFGTGIFFGSAACAVEKHNMPVKGETSEMGRGTYNTKAARMLWNTAGGNMVMLVPESMICPPEPPDTGTRVLPTETPWSER
jgi:hypothetical protein